LTQTEWKKCYRQLRINRREMRLATIDKILYGTGFLHVTSGGEIRRVPPEEVYELNQEEEER